MAPSIIDVASSGPIQRRLCMQWECPAFLLLNSDILTVASAIGCAEASPPSGSGIPRLGAERLPSGHVAEMREVMGFKKNEHTGFIFDRSLMPAGDI